MIPAFAHPLCVAGYQVIYKAMFLSLGYCSGMLILADSERESELQLASVRLRVSVAAV